LTPLLKCLDDKIEKIRETALKMLLKIIGQVELDDKINYLILISVISRLNSIPFPETCKNNNYLFEIIFYLAEELRQQLLRVLEKYLEKYPNDLLPVISELSSMLSKALTDSCPEVKIKSSEFLINMSSKMQKIIGPHTKGILISLCLNLKHQHNKIRKVTITVTNILIFRL
jgi:hypothetical protein